MTRNERRIVYSPHALDGLEELEIYIAECDSQRRAEAVLARIEAGIRTLSRMPRMGRAVRGIEPGMRVFAVRPWLIYYSPLPDGVHVHRVIDGRRDLSGPLPGA
ncbi:MAG: type II toxin-antitoxin system RelE/ParE family toxin [Rhizomicrobium sp.]